MYPLNASHPAVKKNTAATSTVSNVIQACYERNFHLDSSPYHSSKQGYNTQKPILTFCLQDKAPFINTSSVQIGSNTAANHVGQNSSAHVARSSRSDLDATHLKWNGLFLKRPIRLPSPHLVGISLGELWMMFPWPAFQYYLEPLIMQRCAKSAKLMSSSEESNP